MNMLQSFITRLRGKASSSSKPSLEQHRQLLQSWRQVLDVCIHLQNQLPPDHLPADITRGIVRAREEIAHTKEFLRQAGETVLDKEDEILLADADTIDHQLRLLETYRRNLVHYQAQYQAYGSAPVPPIVRNSLVDTRAQVTAIKRRLREWQVPIVDLPADEAALPS